MPVISYPLQLLKDIGLAPRRWASRHHPQLLRADKAPHKLYVLDEPRVVLRMADVEKLIDMLRRQVDV